MKKVNVITMGCSKNLVDSEILLGLLEKGKWKVSHNGEGSRYDAVLINTCGFIHDAKQESIDMILDYGMAKQRGDIKKLYVMGCLSERYKKELEAEIPEVDRFFGKFDLKAIAGELHVSFDSVCSNVRKITTPPHYAYLKISEGCNRFCSFCAIPQMTGRHVSRPLEDLAEEAKYLSGLGVKELLMVAQDLSSYGIDLYGKNMLAPLIRLLSGAEGIEWIRLHYLYPSRFPTDILPEIRDNPKVCRYLDIPLQHIANPVLKRMRRHTTREGIETLLRRIRREVPGAAIRTTLMTGFPSETERDFEELVTFVETYRFDRLGVFTYSHEEGTYAYTHFRDDVPDEIKTYRAEKIMEIQQQISYKKNAEKVGLEFRVIIDGREGEFYTGRTEFDSPEVDGDILISSEKVLAPGQFATVRITGADDYDLTGTVAGQ